MIERAGKRGHGSITVVNLWMVLCTTSRDGWSLQDIRGCL